MIVPQGDTYEFLFTTRSFSTGAPTTLSGTPVLSVYEEGNLTQITAGVSLSVDYDSVTGLNQASIVATSGNGYEVGKYYSVVITTGTVGGVSVVGEVVGHFRCGPVETAAGIPDVNVSSIAANAITATSIASNAITSAKIAASAIGASQIATDAITAAKIAADAIGASELAADAASEIATAVWAATTRVLTANTNLNDPTAAAIADAVWDELQSGHVSAGSFGEIATEIANILVDTAEIGAAGAGLTAVPWNASWDAEVQSEVDDALVARGLHYLMNTALPTNWATDITANSALDYLADDGTASYDRTTDSLQALADSGGGGPTAAQIADAVWDEAQSGHVGAGTFGEIATEIAEVLTDTGTTLPATLATAQADLDIITGASGVVIANGSITDASFDTTAGDFHALGIVDQGTAQAATSTTLQLRAAAAFANDELIGAVILITGGSAGVGQVRTITDYVSSTDTATVDAWTTTPTGTITYKIFAAPPAPATAPDVNVATVGGQTASATGTVDFDDLAAVLTDTGTTLPATLSTIAGYIDTEVAAIKAVTDNLPDSGALTSLATAAALATVDSNVDAILVDTGTTLETHLTDIKGATFSGATDSLEAIRNRGDAAWTTGAGGTPPQLLQNTTIATLASQTSFTLTDGSADDDAYNGAVVVVTDQSTATQKAVGSVQDYTGSSKTVTLAADPGVFTMAVGDTIDIIANASSAPTAAQVRAEIDANSTQLAAIVADTNELQTNQGNWLTATGFSTHSAADVWAAGTRTLTANTNLNDPTAAAIADAVWDEAQSGHVGAGTFGEIATETAAIKAVTDALPDSGALTSLATAAALATVDSNVDAILVDTGTTLPATLTTIAGYIDTEVAAIKAVTDNLPDSGALTSLATAAALTTVDTVVDAIKAKTDSLTFTIAGCVDANTEYINGAEVVGDGNATPWDGA